MGFTRWLPAAVAALLLFGSGDARPDGGKKPAREESSFGSLKAPAPAEARTQAEAWLKSVGKTDEATLWARDDSLDNAGLWTGDAAFVDGKIKAAKKQKKRLICRSAVFEGNDPQFAAILEEPNGVPWLESYGLSFLDCKAWVESHKADGWRPDHLYYYGVSTKRLFGGILIKDPNRSDWDVSWACTLAEYEKELAARNARGFRPLTAFGHEDSTGAQRFSVVWIRYRLPG